MKLDSGIITLSIYYALSLLIVAHFAHAAIQGDSGRFARIGILDEEEDLKAELAELSAEVEGMQNKVRRLSDEYLDLELLDERVRVVLGYGGDYEIILQ